MEGLLLSTLPGIDQPGLKLGWAKHHLHLLEKEIHRFLNRPPYTVIGEDDLYAGEYRVSVDVEAIPSSVVLMLGDFIHCLRCSLDHLASHLTLTSQGSPNAKASFPIMAVNNTSNRKSFAAQLLGVPDRAIEIIESLQPYHAGNLAEKTKLWQLHRLWNIDKHRRIPALYTSAQLGFSYPSHITPISKGNDNSGIVRFPLSTKPYVKVDPTIEIEILFGDESEGIVVAPIQLAGIYKFVDEEVFPRFESFF